MVISITPLARLSCENSIKLALAINSPVMVIPIYDFISSTGNLNQKFDEVVRCGGLHNFLKYPGIVILSSIMNDDLVKKFGSYQEYANLINGLKPDFYFTPDGETYERRDEKSLLEIRRLSLLTKELIKLCPHSKPIGLVKGSNRLQIIGYRNFLKELGINIFAFHVGDFFRNGSREMIRRARYYCSLIKEKENFLMLYGLGSPSMMLEFSFSDMFITYTHFVNAKHKKIFIEKKKIKFFRGSVYRAALHNFRQLLMYLNDLKCQTKLFGGESKWGEELQEQELLLLTRDRKPRK